MNGKALTQFGGFQGDVAIKTVSEIPADATPTQNRILAFGEATGHNHVLTGDVVVLETKESFYFTVAPEGEAQIVHPEHDTIQIAPGAIYEVGKTPQVEFHETGPQAVRD